MATSPGAAARAPPLRGEGDLAFLRIEVSPAASSHHLSLHIDPPRSPPRSIDDIGSLRTALGADHSKGVELLAAKLTAALQCARNLSEREASLLRWLQLALLRGSGAKLRCAELAWLESQAPSLHRAARQEYDRWVKGERTLLERAVYRTMQARERAAVGRRLHEERVRQAHMLASKEQERVVQHWKNGLAKRNLRSEERASRVAASICADRFRGARHTIKALRSKGVHALTDDESALLDDLRLLLRMERGHTPSTEEQVRLENLQNSWHQAVFEPMRTRLRGEEVRKQWSAATELPPPHPSPRQVERWHRMLMEDIIKPNFLQESLSDLQPRQADWARDSLFRREVPRTPSCTHSRRARSATPRVSSYSPSSEGVLEMKLLREQELAARSLGSVPANVRSTSLLTGESFHVGNSQHAAVTHSLRPKPERLVIPNSARELRSPLTPPGSSPRLATYTKCGEAALCGVQVHRRRAVSASVRTQHDAHTCPDSLPSHHKDQAVKLWVLQHLPGVEGLEMVPSCV